jgi:hypothetical protein
LDVRKELEDGRRAKGREAGVERGEGGEWEGGSGRAGEGGNGLPAVKEDLEEH